MKLLEQNDVLFIEYRIKLILGRAMAQELGRRPLTAEARVSSCWVCGVQSGTETGFSKSSWGFPCYYHYTVAPYLYNI
jgi:hypothetical protein